MKGFMLVFTLGMLICSKASIACTYWGGEHFKVNPNIFTVDEDGYQLVSKHQYRSHQEFFDNYLGENNWQWASDDQLKLVTPDGDIVEDPSMVKVEANLMFAVTSQYELEFIIKPVYKGYFSRPDARQGMRFYNSISTIKLAKQVNSYVFRIRIYDDADVYVVFRPMNNDQVLLVSKPKRLKTYSCSSVFYVESQELANQYNQETCLPHFDQEKEPACRELREHGVMPVSFEDDYDDDM